jgi:hypothetical protein
MPFGSKAFFLPGRRQPNIKVKIPRKVEGFLQEILTNFIFAQFVQMPIAGKRSFPKTAAANPLELIIETFAKSPADGSVF